MSGMTCAAKAGGRPPDDAVGPTEIVVLDAREGGHLGLRGVQCVER